MNYSSVNTRFRVSATQLELVHFPGADSHTPQRRWMQRPFNTGVSNNLETAYAAK